MNGQGIMAGKNQIELPTREDILAKPMRGKLTVSHTKRIKFSDGVVLELNHKQRRKMKLYNRNLRRM